MYGYPLLLCGLTISLTYVSSIIQCIKTLGASQYAIIPLINISSKYYFKRLAVQLSICLNRYNYLKGETNYFNAKTIYRSYYLVYIWALRELFLLVSKQDNAGIQLWDSSALSGARIALSSRVATPDRSKSRENWRGFPIFITEAPRLQIT